jgi:hypothetical protein
VAIGVLFPNALAVVIVVIAVVDMEEEDFGQHFWTTPPAISPDMARPTMESPMIQAPVLLRRARAKVVME